jgi:hypothetical protein
LPAREVVRAADVVVTMGCGDACPVYPGMRYQDWVLDDPAGLGVDVVRPIRDQIEKQVRGLIARTARPGQVRLNAAASMRLLVVGGSDAGIAAGLRARQVDPDADVTGLVADAHPNFSICGIPSYVSGDAARRGSPPSIRAWWTRCRACRHSSA